MAWSEILLREFVSKLNINNFNLSFTMNFDSSKLEFLDIEIKKDPQGLISTNLFRKKTASNSLLHAKSMHPFKCIEGIPKGQYIRLRRICSSDEDFKNEAYKLYQRFKMRGIGNLLTQSHFQKQPNKFCCKTTGSFRCGDCEQCRFIKPSKMFGKTGLEFKMYHYTCCTTTHVIYLFTCHCGSLYVGKTKRPFKRRIYKHLLDIKNCNLLSSIAKHIHCAHGGTFAGSFFQGIDRIHGDLRGGDLDKRLLQLETTWIFRLNAYKSELGLNGHLNFQAFI
ncbi:hypothetical protein XELAEV_18027932mg [Xenopus laevis]|uniref:GIY-YIG domain-containing protein n=1 Tax=Xenopus laevis TaxID=8355 RepID=A0A974CWC4_XENLA|nr:hypothetical protein XELAEV_18027932mg [Xenopus laevis]